MTVTVRGTDILFNDSTTQSTAAVAPTTATVLSATAGATVGTVGTYAFLGEIFQNVTTAPGGTRAGSSMRFAGVAAGKGWDDNAFNSINKAQNANNGGAPAGTWRCMGFASAASNTGYDPAAYPATLWLRIS